MRKSQAGYRDGGSSFWRDSKNKIKNKIKGGGQGHPAHINLVGRLPIFSPWSASQSIQLFPGFAGHIGEAKSGAAGFIHPGDLYFGFQRGGDSRQFEGCRGHSAFRQLASEENRHAALADIGHGGFQLLPSPNVMVAGISTGKRKYRRCSRIMKLIAALRQRLAFSAEMGFCRTKFAPI